MTTPSPRQQAIELVDRFRAKHPGCLPDSEWSKLMAEITALIEQTERRVAEMMVDG